MLIRDLTQVATLDDNDLVVIYDHAAGRTRSATFGLVKSYVDPVVEGHYQGTDLILVLESGNTITIPGVTGEYNPLSPIDLSTFSKVYEYQKIASYTTSAPASSATLSLDIPDGVGVVVLDALKAMPDGTLTKVAAMNYVYDTTNKTLTVSFGESANQVTITICVLA